MIKAVTLATAVALSSLSLAAFADQTVRIPENQHTFTLQLNANATTGYQWFLENYNPTYFTYLGYHYVSPSNNPNGPKLMGAPGLAQFKFQVNPVFHQGPLTSQIHLVYGQPWNMTATTGTTITLVSEPSIKKNFPAISNSAPPAINTLPNNPEMAPPPPSLESELSAPQPNMATVGSPADSPAQQPASNWLSLPKKANTAPPPESLNTPNDAANNGDNADADGDTDTSNNNNAMGS